MMRLKFVKTTLLGAALVACASGPRPRALDEANERLSSSRAERLAASRPQLIEESRQYAKASKKAHERGDGTAAELNANLAVQRFETAENLEARELAETRQRAMTKAVDTIDDAREIAERERDALVKFRNAEGRFAALEAELSRIRADDQSAEAMAKRAIVAARRAQAQAVGASAPSLAKAQYEEATVLLDNSMAALQANLNEDAKGLADASRDKYAEAIAQAETNGANRSKTASADEALKAQAKAALEDAETARGAALAGRMKIRDPGRFEQGESLLTVARARFTDGDWAGTESRAKQALEVFRGKSDASSGQQAIAAAEEARAAALGRGAAGTPQVAQADSMLSLARGALVNGYEPRTKTLADQARALYLGAGGSGLMSAAPTTGTGLASGTPANLHDAFARFSVEQALLEVRKLRADALSEGKERTCPDGFRGFEAMIELAVERLDKGSLVDAAQLTARASERLRMCGRVTEAKSALAPVAKNAPTRPSAAAASKTATAVAAKEPPAERRGRESAEAAIALSQRLFVKAKTSKTPQDQLEEPQLLLQEAQRWYERAAWKQAQSMAEEATKLLRAIKKAPPLAPGAVAAKTGRLPDKNTAAAAPGRSKCPGLDSKLSGARMARSTAGAKADTPEKQARLMRGMQMLSAVEGLVKDGRCNEAATFLNSVNETFAEVRAPATSVAASAAPSAAPSAVAAAATMASKPVGCDTFDRREDDLRVSQGVASAAVRTSDDREIFTRAVRSLQRARNNADANRCPDALALLDDAQRGFEGLSAKLSVAPAVAPAPRATQSTKSNAKADPKAATPRATAAAAPAARGAASTPSDSSWKPAYQAVLDTLVLRDRAAAAAKSDAERERLNTANGFMTKSRQSWDSKNFVAAERYAQAATSDYEAVLALAKKRGIAQGAAKGDAKAQAAAAKEAAEKLKATEASKAEALASLEQTQQQLRAAGDALREVEVMQARCDEKGCSRIDPAGSALAIADVDAARAAYNAARYPEAIERSAAAKTRFVVLMKAPTTFTVPADARGVTRLGDQLRLSPRVLFESGGDTIASTSLASVDALARTLIANQAVLSRVELIGFTDSRGKPAGNQALSQRRAESLGRALVDRGVPGELLATEGRGEEEPIANNKTADGRERNRRVEVRLALR